MRAASQQWLDPRHLGGPVSAPRLAPPFSAGVNALLGEPAGAGGSHEKPFRVQQGGVAGAPPTRNPAGSTSAQRPGAARHSCAVSHQLFTEQASHSHRPEAPPSPGPLRCWPACGPAGGDRRAPAREGLTQTPARPRQAALGQSPGQGRLLWGGRRGHQGAYGPGPRGPAPSSLQPHTRQSPCHTHKVEAEPTAPTFWGPRTPGEEAGQRLERGAQGSLPPGSKGGAPLSELRSPRWALTSGPAFSPQTFRLRKNRGLRANVRE